MNDKLGFFCCYLANLKICILGFLSPWNFFCGLKRESCPDSTIFLPVEEPQKSPSRLYLSAASLVMSLLSCWCQQQGPWWSERRQDNSHAPQSWPISPVSIQPHRRGGRKSGWWLITDSLFWALPMSSGEKCSVWGGGMEKNTWNYTMKSCNLTIWLDKWMVLTCLKAP